MHNHLFHMAIDWMNKLNLPFLSPFMWPQKHLGCVQSLLKEREKKKKRQQREFHVQIGPFGSGIESMHGSKSARNFFSSGSGR